MSIPRSRLEGRDDKSKKPRDERGFYFIHHKPITAQLCMIELSLFERSSTCPLRVAKQGGRGHGESGKEGLFSIGRRAAGAP
mgnify:CR=1 FL=1